MATPTTLNIGEPADERSVDGNSIPLGDATEGGDQEGACEGLKQIREEQYYAPDIEDVDADLADLSRYHLDLQYLQEQDESYHYDYNDESENDNAAGTESTGIVNFIGIFPECRIKPSDVGFKIVPAVGAVCYEYFSLTVMNPQWFSRAFGTSEMAVRNTVWFQAHIGTALYLYSRRHMRKLSLPRSLLYSLFGSVVFNFGSLLIWGWGRSLLPQSAFLRTAFGLISGGVLLYTAHDYLQLVDNECSELD